MARPRDIGTRAETAVVKVLRANGWPSAERRALRGTADAGDITGTPGICWEVKGGEAARRASDAQIEAWLAETEMERQVAGAKHGVLVVQRAGIGHANAHRWWAIVPMRSMHNLLLALYVDAPGDIPVRLTLGDMCAVLRAAGYGEPLTIDTKD